MKAKTKAKRGRPRNSRLEIKIGREEASFLGEVAKITHLKVSDVASVIIAGRIVGWRGRMPT